MDGTVVRRRAGSAGPYPSVGFVRSAARLASQAFQGYQRYAAQERTRRPYSGPAPVRRARGYVPTRPFKISKPKTLKSVAKTVKKLSKRVREGEITYDYRVRNVFLITKAVNENASDNQCYFGRDSINAVVDQLEYWDPATNTFTARDVTSGTTQKVIGIDSVQSFSNLEHYQFLSRLKSLFASKERYINIA